MAEDIYNNFEEWLQKQTYWLQDATWNLYNNKPIEYKEIENYVDMCLAEVRNEIPSFHKLNDISVIKPTSEMTLSIKKVSDIKNVNALADGASLEFGENGISVVYGLNGAGKSGFVRIFKHICGHPYSEPIQQNVYKKNIIKDVSCKCHICVNGSDEYITCNLKKQSLNDRLQQCDVFDTRISGAYVSDSKDVSYEPFVFFVLKELALIAGRIKANIDRKIESLPQLELRVPENIKELDEAKWIESISETTAIPMECRNWSTTDEDRINLLSKLLDEEQVQNEIKFLKQKKNQISSVLIDLREIKDSILGKARKEFLDAYNDLKISKKQLELASALFAENASEQDKINASIAEWKELWQVGKKYYELCIHKKNNIPFGGEGSVCPLCLQPLDGDTLKRFSSVDEYVNGNCSDLYKKAEECFKIKAQKLFRRELSSDLVSNMLSESIDKDTLKSVLSLYSQIKEWESSYADEMTVSEIEACSSISIVEVFEDMLAAIDKEICNLSESLNPEKNIALEREEKKLQYRKWVYNQSKVIQENIDNMKKKSELKSASKYINTNTITRKSNELADILITEAYIKRFTEEMNYLAPSIKVKLEKGRSVKGKTPYKVVLDTTDNAKMKPQDILSEGEQRIVSLATFFADATGRSERTPIVIDDPISSLDYNYEDRATKRIIELAKERQVILFTHRISLLIGLSENSQKEGVAFTEKYIRGTSAGNGLSDFEDIYHGKIKKQLEALKKLAQDAKKMEPYSREYLDRCSRIFQQLRICIERSIEDILFQEMIKRFSRRIMTGKLLKMDRISKEDCEIIDSMMTKYSFEEHSQPEDSGLVSIDLDDTIKDIDNFIEWIKEYTNKMNSSNA